MRCRVTPNRADTMPLKVIITRDFDHMSEVAGKLVIDRIAGVTARGVTFNLGLATGNSPTGAYKWLAKAANAGAFDASKVTSFNLDEYVGLPGENAQARALHSESYNFFMVQELFGLLRTSSSRTSWSASWRRTRGTGSSRAPTRARRS